MTSDASVFQRYAFISLGANLNSSFGAPRESIEYAIKALANFSSKPLLISSLIETKPLDCPPNSPDYVNGLVGLIPDEQETALSLLRKLQGLENKVGRVRSAVINEARVLDLDIVFFKDESHQSESLTIPHPRAHRRRFVLEPLMELVGDKYFFGQDALISDLIIEAS